MDVFQYFDPVDFSAFSFQENLNKNSLGSWIEKSNKKLQITGMHRLEVAIFGVSAGNNSLTVDYENAPDKIRAELYNLSNFDLKLNIADFGNLKTAKTKRGLQLALRDIIEYFGELNIKTIVIGGSQELSIGISEAFKNKSFFTLTSVDSFLDVKKGKEILNSTNYLSSIFSRQSNLFQYSLLGYQKLLVPDVLFSKTRGIGVHYRLGLLRENLSISEPVLRNTDFLTFDIGAVKYADAPGTKYINPNGLRSEEACQLAKYAGLSEKLCVFGLFDVDVDNDRNNLTVKLSAQIIWYFLDALVHTQGNKPEYTENRITYKVEVKELEKPLVFLQCQHTSRWWMKIESISGESLLVACSEDDYRQASNNEIPELWLKYVQKIDEFSK